MSCGEPPPENAPVRQGDNKPVAVRQYALRALSHSFFRRLTETAQAI
jgi:hypothetical protein